MLGPEQRLGPLDGQVFHLVDVLLALVIALAGIAFRILVGQDRAGGLHDRGGHVVFRRDQPDLVFLADFLLTDQVEDLRIALFQVPHIDSFSRTVLVRTGLIARGRSGMGSVRAAERRFRGGTGGPRWPRAAFRRGRDEPPPPVPLPPCSSRPARGKGSASRTESADDNQPDGSCTAENDHPGKARDNPGGPPTGEPLHFRLARVCLHTEGPAAPVRRRRR